MAGDQMRRACSCVFSSYATNTHHDGQAACLALSDTCKFIPGLELQGSMELQRLQAPETANLT